ncbi:DNA-binding transcriptional LysR family regulator [Actimicrobium sp. GrIS 1.19]|uniref:LysR family transcriptional regulator n=1 Tax=Actimicrobium sp. GrIS 1.19 TaxID=3071708 RepID=UPI002DFA59E7|nr:DNA-binding transcriptional LysR family regulator [Actimicrobium sp. GrIS 1.19]
MNLTLEALRILDMIDRKGSFAAAAVALDRVPSSLTYTVRKLEDDLDVLLFDRRGHRARLTDAGSELLIEGRHLLRAADQLEQRVKRTATGWEVELRIVVDSMVPFESMLPLIADFSREGSGTRLRFSEEVMNGTWEALLHDRADLIIGATQDSPEIIRMSGDFQTRPLGSVEWMFAVAQGHPLAHQTEPISAAMLQQHRAVAVGDSGRALAAITVGLLSGQDTLTVPSVRAKLLAQVAGLGCGHLPRSLAAPYLASGALNEKQTTEPKPAGHCMIAWRNAARGKCLAWFLDRLAQPATQHAMLGQG